MKTTMKASPRLAEPPEEHEEKKESPAAEDAGMLNRLLASRTVIVSGQVDSELAQKVIQQLVLLDHENSGRRITLLINSPGGEVYSGFAIYDFVRYISAPVVSVVVGLAASMGTILALSAPKGSRYATPNAKFLIHQPLMTGYQGRAMDIEIQAKEILRDRDRLVDIYAESTGRPPKDIARDIDRDRWMSATEAREYGLVDRIITKRSELPKG